ncbi:MAG: M23 family metallopeptidase [Pyrinomonadaceae bacterium]
MEPAGPILKRIAIATYLVVLHIVVIYFIGDRILDRNIHFGPQPLTENVIDPMQAGEIPTPLPVPSIIYEPSPQMDPIAPVPNIPSTTGEGLIVPVAGVRPEQLTDAFSDARSGGRIHDAIDIMAPLGSPVLAAMDGKIARFFDSELGGITIYQLTDDGKFVLYYAHLQKRADGIVEGMPVKKGQAIGYVGDTGNAGAGNFHLHFSIARVIDPKRYWEGTYINPYPLLKFGGKLE